MKKASLEHPLHDWEKLNLASRSNGRNFYDEYKCRKCKIKGNKYSLMPDVTVPDSCADEKINWCDNGRDPFIGLSLTVIRCTSESKVFANVIPNSIHTIVSPRNNVNGDDGVWIMGNGEKIKLYFNEFAFKAGSRRTGMQRTKSTMQRTTKNKPTMTRVTRADILIHKGNLRRTK